MNLNEALALGRLDAHDQAALIRSGEMTAVEAVEAAILRIEALDPDLNALTARCYDLARARAAGPLPNAPLAGVPWLIKDSLDYPGLPSRAGSRSRSDVAVSRSFPFTQRWDEEGLIPLGKSAMPEFGLLPTTEPLLHAPSRNPWSLEHSPGGSSGGAGAALAAGIVALAHGSDGAGSIRIPASCCGVVGLKPGRGASVRVRSRSVIEDLLVGDVLMSRSVRDTAWAFAAAHPRRPEMVRGASPRRLRIGLCLESVHGAAPEPEVADAARAAAALCETLGHAVDIVTPSLDRDAILEAMQTLWIHDGADTVDAARAAGLDVGAVLEPWTLALGALADAMPVETLERAFAQVAALPQTLGASYARYDVMLTPTLTARPPRIGEMGPTLDPILLMDRMFGWCGYTFLQNLSGTPAISLPLARSAAGLPIGVMFAADRGGEETLLALAYELEAAQPWTQIWPERPRHAAGA